jgi:hypothetical protein
MAKLLFALLAGICGVFTTTAVASAESLQDQLGLTASTLIALGWLGLLTLLALAIILPLVRH